MMKKEISHVIDVPKLLERPAKSFSIRVINRIGNFQDSINVLDSPFGADSRKDCLCYFD